jgi:preprotein translocase subunit SecG
MVLTLLGILFTLLCIFLVFIILIQPGGGEQGLASAFGGGSSDTFFGTKAGQHINRFTVILAIIFLLLAIVLNKVRHSASKETVTPPRSSAPVK